MIAAPSTYPIKCEASRKAAVKVNSFTAPAVLPPAGRSPANYGVVRLLADRPVVPP